MLYHCLSLYFPPTQNVSSADSPWWLLNQDDKQLKNLILIGCSNDKALTKHALFYVFSARFSKERTKMSLSWINCKKKKNKNTLPSPALTSLTFLFSVDVSVTSFGVATILRGMYTYTCMADVLMTSIQGNTELSSSASTWTLSLCRNPDFTYSKYSAGTTSNCI